MSLRHSEALAIGFCVWLPSGVAYPIAELPHHVIKPLSERPPVRRIHNAGSSAKLIEILVYNPFRYRKIRYAKDTAP